MSERIEVRPGDTVYFLQESTDRGDAWEMVRTIDPECLEIADEILNEAEKTFGKIDRSILFPMADHIEYAVKNREQISNPLTEDIRILFHMEYKVALCIVPILERRMGIRMGEDEVGYIALHIHSAIEDEKVSRAMHIERVTSSELDIEENEE